MKESNIKMRRELCERVLSKEEQKQAGGYICCYGILRRLYLRRMIEGKVTTIKTSLLICEKCGSVHLDSADELVLTDVKDEGLIKQMKRYKKGSEDK